jgi:exopolysaccharide biosynthesis polyprenyl glycosylphosphotransferase
MPNELCGWLGEESRTLCSAHIDIFPGQPQLAESGEFSQAHAVHQGLPRAQALFMATDFSLPAPEKIAEFSAPSARAQPSTMLRGAMGVAMPAVLDCCCIALACITGILLYGLHRPIDGGQALLLWAELCLKYGLAFVILAQAHHLYTQRATLLQVADTARVMKVSVYGLTLLSVSTYFTKANMPRLLLTYFWGFATVLLVMQKHTTSKLIRDWRAVACRQRRVLICGTNRETRRLFSYLLHSPHLGQIPVGFLDETGFEDRRVIYSHDYNLKHHAPVIPEPLSHSLLRSLDIQEIFVTHTVSQLRMNELMALAASAGVTVNLVGAGHPYFVECCATVQMIDGLMVTTFDADGDAPLAYIACKRVTDMFLASLLILLALPLWLLAAVMVKATSKGPVFFRQERTGQAGKPFIMLKFRSMYVDAPKYGRSPESSTDKRITPAGRFLRRTSLDELPQLLNVLKGEMSLVGPRPEMPYITDTYTSIERRRLSVPQGLTGLWQLSGDRRFMIHQAIEYDLYYIENRGFFLDLAILFHTLFFAMKGL